MTHSTHWSRSDLLAARIWPAKYLSQGQKRRVALSRLVQENALWVLDEPFVALDAAAVSWLAGVIGHLQRSGMAVLTTHQAVSIPPVPGN